MATISFNVPDAHVNDMVDGLSRFYGYRDVLDDGTDNPETKAQYARRKIAAEIKDHAMRGLKIIQVEMLTDVPPVDVDPV